MVSCCPASQSIAASTSSAGALATSRSRPRVASSHQPIAGTLEAGRATREMISAQARYRRRPGWPSGAGKPSWRAIAATALARRGAGRWTFRRRTGVWLGQASKTGNVLCYKAQADAGRAGRFRPGFGSCALSPPGTPEDERADDQHAEHNQSWSRRPMEGSICERSKQQAKDQVELKEEAAAQDESRQSAFPAHPRDARGYDRERPQARCPSSHGKRRAPPGLDERGPATDPRLAEPQGAARTGR